MLVRENCSVNELFGVSCFVVLYLSGRTSKITIAPKRMKRPKIRKVQMKFVWE